MTDYRHQRWNDEIEEQEQENRERFWREAAEEAEYWRRVAAGEIKPGEDDGECETEDRREDRSPVQGVPGDSGGPQRDSRDATPDVADDGRVRTAHGDDGAGLDSPRVDGDMPAEGGGDQ